MQKENAIKILEGLRSEIKSLSDHATITNPAYRSWQQRVNAAVVHIFPNHPNHLEQLKGIVTLMLYPTGRVTNPNPKKAAQDKFRSGLGKVDAFLHALIDEVRTYWDENGPLSNKDMQRSKFEATPTDPRVVFVVHGRNTDIRDSMFQFLRWIGLRPLEWEQARAETKKPSPYVGEILQAAFSKAQAVVVVMTPDDEARLKQEFYSPNEPVHEKELTGQARPNVLFEAGMAMARDDTRTVLVEVGTLRKFTDIDGIHTVRLNDSGPKRQELANRLKTAGCPVDITGTDWHSVGSFQIAEASQPSPSQVVSEPKPTKSTWREVLRWLDQMQPQTWVEPKVISERIRPFITLEAVTEYCEELRSKDFVEMAEFGAYRITPKGKAFVRNQ